MENLSSLSGKHVASVSVGVCEVVPDDGDSPVKNLSRDLWKYIFGFEIDFIVEFGEKLCKRIRPECETERIACVREGGVILCGQHKPTSFSGDIFGSFSKKYVGDSVIVGGPDSVVFCEMDDVYPFHSPSFRVRVNGLRIEQGLVFSEFGYNEWDCSTKHYNTYHGEESAMHGFLT